MSNMNICHENIYIFKKKKYDKYDDVGIKDINILAYSLAQFEAQ